MNSLKSLEICPAIFQNWKKSGRMVNKSLEFFQSYNKYFIHVSEFCFVFLNLHVCLHCVVKKSFVPAFLRSLLITYLLTLSLEKEIILLKKCQEKVLCWWFSYHQHNYPSQTIYGTTTVLFRARLFKAGLR